MDDYVVSAEDKSRSVDEKDTNRKGNVLKFVTILGYNKDEAYFGMRNVTGFRHP